MSEHQDHPATTTLGAEGVRYGVVVALVLVVLAGVLVWRDPEGRFVTAAVYPLVAAAVLVASIVRHRSDRVRLEDDALVVLTRGAETRYPWTQVLEVSWTSPSWPYLAGGPVLRVRGGPFDVPGPNAPAQVARLVVFGPRATGRAQQALRRAATARGLPYTDKLQELLDTGKRMPRLPRLPGEPR